jgi:hypothetical protein
MIVYGMYVFETIQFIEEKKKEEEKRQEQEQEEKKKLVCFECISNILFQSVFPSSVVLICLS